MCTPSLLPLNLQTCTEQAQLFSERSMKIEELEGRLAKNEGEIASKDAQIDFYRKAALAGAVARGYSSVQEALGMPNMARISCNVRAVQVFLPVLQGQDVACMNSLINRR